jgi:hypothetical protein
MTNFVERHFKAFCNEGSLWIYVLSDGSLRAHVIGFYDDLAEAWIRVEDLATSHKRTTFQKVQAVFEAFTNVLTMKYPYYTWEDFMFVDGAPMPLNETTIQHIDVRDADEPMETHHVWKLLEYGSMDCPDLYEAIIGEYPLT